MGTVYAIKTGDWSDTSTWNTGVKPVLGDDVFANGYQVTIDESVVVDSLTNASGSGISAGGKFIVDDDISISFSSFEPVGLIEDGLIEIVSDCSVIITGDVTSGSSDGTGIYIGTNTITEVNLEVSSVTAKGDDSAAIFANYGKLVLNVIGDIKASTDGSSIGVHIDDSADLELTVGGDILGGEGTSAVLTDSGDISVTVAGDVVGGTEPSKSGLTISAGTLTAVISGSVYGGTADNSYGISIGDGTSQVDVTGALGGGSGEGANAIFANSGDLTLNVGGSVGGGLGDLSSAILCNDASLDLSCFTINGGAGDYAFGVEMGTENLSLDTNYIVGGTGESAIGVRILSGNANITSSSVSAGSGVGASAIFSESITNKPRVVNILGATALDGTPAIKMNYKSDTVTVQGTVTASANGTQAIQVPIIKLNPSQDVFWAMRNTLGNTVSLSNVGTGSVDLPAATDVRAGVIFGGGTSIGTMAIPSPKQVSHGVPVDNTVGIVALSLPQVVNYFGEQIRAAFNLESGLVFIESVVYHGANSTFTRPENPGSIIWIGSVEPLNALDGDGWIKE